jgi:hypothetical protein
VDQVLLQIKSRLGKWFHDQELFQSHYMGLGDLIGSFMLEILQPVCVPDNMFKGYDFPI